MLKKRSVFLVFILLMLAGCGDVWVAQINGEKITLKEFNSYYYANQRSIYDKSNDEIDKIAQDPQALQQNPYLKKQQYLEQLIRQKLAMKKIDQEAILKDDPEFKLITQIQRETITVSYYAKKKFAGKLDVSPEEVNSEFVANKDYYAQFPPLQVESIIRQNLQGKKFVALADATITELKQKNKTTKDDALVTALKDPDAAKRPKEGNVLSIEGDQSLSVKDFEAIYYAQMRAVYNISNEEIDKVAADEQSVKQNPLLDKQVFVDELLRQKLVYKEAIESKEFDIKNDKDLEYLIATQQNIISVTQYIKKKHEKELEPTLEEIDSVYQANKDRYQNIPATDIERYLKPMILQQKLQMKTYEFIQQLIEDSQIVYNNKALKGEEEPKK